jgi:hypothetical protein
MLPFLFGFACGVVSTVLFVAALYFVVDKVVRPPSGG